MKRLVYLLMAIAALASCSKQRTFTVEGTVEGAKDSTLYLYNYTINGVELLDSAKLGADGRFSFSPPAPEGPDLYVLRISGEWINLGVDSTETITVKASWPGMSRNYSIEGSAGSEHIRQLALMHSRLQERVLGIEQNPALLGVMRDSVSRLVQLYKDSVFTNFIVKEPQSIYAYYALMQTLDHVYQPSHFIFELGNHQDDRAYRAVATCWKEYYPQWVRAQQLYNRVERDITDKRIGMARQQQFEEENRVVVAGIIDLSLPDITGKERTLSELKGKVVLLDFHAFALPESGQRILKLRDLYNRYHERGLEIYQVAIDADEHLWRQAVAQLPWISVYDGAGESCVRYNVQEVPEFFTIDRENMLQKRSSQIDNLDKEIESML